MAVDAELRVIAERSAARYPDATVHAAGWTRTELVDAIHARLRNKYSAMRDAGDLIRDPHGEYRLREPDECPTPEKQVFESETAAKHAHRRSRLARKTRLHPYLCPSGQHWHLTSQTPEQQREVAQRIARKARTT